MKTLRLISFMVLGYSVVALYLALVYWGVWCLILFFEVLYEHNNRIRNWIDAGDMVWNRACSSIECKWEEIRCHFWEAFFGVLVIEIVLSFFDPEAEGFDKIIEEEAIEDVD